MEQDYVRNDMVWFCEKQDNGASEYYSAQEFNLHKNNNIAHFYRSGKLGAKPILGDPLLRETDKWKGSDHSRSQLELLGKGWLSVCILITFEKTEDIHSRLSQTSWIVRSISIYPETLPQSSSTFRPSLAMQIGLRSAMTLAASPCFVIFCFFFLSVQVLLRLQCRSGNRETNPCLNQNFPFLPSEKLQPKNKQGRPPKTKHDSLNLWERCM